jgi:hypothetical protein
MSVPITEPDVRPTHSSAMGAYDDVNQIIDKFKEVYAPPIHLNAGASDWQKQNAVRFGVTPKDAETIRLKRELKNGPLKDFDISITESDLSALDKQKRTDNAARFASWFLGQFDLDKPGELEKVRQIYPGLIDNIKRTYETEAYIKAKKELIKRLGPQDLQDYVILFMERNADMSGTMWQENVYTKDQAGPTRKPINVTGRYGGFPNKIYVPSVFDMMGMTPQQGRLAGLLFGIRDPTKGARITFSQCVNLAKCIEDHLKVDGATLARNQTQAYKDLRAGKIKTLTPQDIDTIRRYVKTNMEAVLAAFVSAEIPSDSFAKMNEVTITYSYPDSSGQLMDGEPKTDYVGMWFSTTPTITTYVECMAVFYFLSGHTDWTGLPLGTQSVSLQTFFATPSFEPGTL